MVVCVMSSSSQKMLKALRSCSPCCAEPEQPQPRADREMGPDEEPTYNNYAEAFSYENLQSKKYVMHRGYTATEKGQFFWVARDQGNASADKLGWKIHISLDDADINNISKGWNIVKDILIGSNLDYFKVVIPGVKKDQIASNYEIGRQITIYATDDPRVYPNIIQRITDEFVKQGVNPGFKPMTDRQVSGSNYFYYRNDDDGRGVYLPVERATSYNDTGKNDPFIDMRVNCDNQSQVKAKSTGTLALESMFNKP